MEYEDDVYVDIIDESPVDKGKVDVECGEFDRWDGGGGSVSRAEDSDHVYGYCRYRNEVGEYGGSASYKVRSVVSVAEVYAKVEAENEVAGLSSRHGREVDDDEEEEERQVSGRSGKCGFGGKERKRNYRRRNVVDGDLSDEEDTGKFNVHESADKEFKRNYWLRKVMDGDLSDEEDGERDKLTRKFSVHDSGDKGFKRNYRRRNVDGGDSSGDEDEEQNTRRVIMHLSKDKERVRNYRRGKVIHDEFSDEKAQEEELFKGKHLKRGSGDKAHSRSYSRASLVDDDYIDDKVKEEHFPKKLSIHESGDKEHKRIYRHGRVVDDDYSDNEMGEKQISRKPIARGSGDKEHTKIYGHRRVIDNDYSDNEVDERKISRKPIVRGSDDKEHTKIYGHRREVDYDYSDNEMEERQITSKTIECGSADKQHRRNSKRRRVVGDDYSDKEFEFFANHSKECDDSAGQESHNRRILSRHHSRSRDETVSEDNIEKDRDERRHRDDSIERNRDHQHDKHLKRHRYDTVKERGGDPKVDKYKRGSRDAHHYSKYNSENDDEADDFERRTLKKDSEYHHMKERGRNAKEEKSGKRPEIHHSARHQSGDYDWETLITERKRDCVFLKERGNDAEEDKYNRKLTGARHSARYQNEHDDDWETKIMEKERCSWEQGKEMFDIYEMKNKGRDKYHDFRGHGKDTFRKTSLMERENERELREKGEDFLEEGQEINGHVQGRLGRKETNSVERDLRVQVTEAKEKNHRRELEDRKHGRESMEQQSQSLDMSLKRELKERQKETDFTGHDREFFGKGKEIHRTNVNKVESWKLHFSESTVNKWERQPIGRISEKEKVHTVIRKKDLSERDITSREDSHKSKRDREMEEIISKRDFCRKVLRKQDMEDRMHVVRETGSEDYNIRSREASHEIEWDVETGQRYKRRELMSSNKREREGMHTILERDGECRLTVKLQKREDKKKQEEYQERELTKEGMETNRRHLAERGTWKPDIEIREQSLEMEELHKENERYSMTGDINTEKSHQNEHLNKAEERLRGESNNRSHWKTLENDLEDNENLIDIITWDMEKCQRKELFNKEEVKNRRESVRTSLEDNLEKDLLDKNNDRCPVIRDSECREKCTKTTGETIRESTEEKEKCREQHKETKIIEPEADAGTELERQQKAVLAYQISTEANDRDLYDFFSKAGKVRDVRLVLDPISRHFIGVGYIEFWCSLSIPIAVSLSGKLLHGQPVLVKPPEAGENQLFLSEKAAGSNGPCSRVSKRLCVGNLHDSVTETLLHQVFKSFGTTDLVQLDSAEAGHCERKCIIQFACLEDARAALSLNGHLALAGQLVKVSSINDYEEILVLSTNNNDCIEAEGNDLVSDTGVQNEMQVASADTNCFNEAEGNDLVSDTGVQNETQGVDIKTINSSEEKGSAMLESDSHKLGSNDFEVNKSSSPVNALPSESLEHPVPPPSIEAFLTSLKAMLLVPSVAIPIVDTVGVPSECLHLKNIFDSNTQASDEFELRVKEDVGELCYKFGKPMEIHIDKNSAGCVYLRFEDTPTAIVVQRALHGTWFAGKMITATYMDRQSYDAKFPNIEQASAQGKPPLAWLPHNNGPGFPITEYTLTQGPTPAMQPPLTYRTNFPTSQQPVATSTMWLPNKNPRALGAGFGNGGQFMQPVPLVPRGNIFTEMRPNAW